MADYIRGILRKKRLFGASETFKRNALPAKILFLISFFGLWLAPGQAFAQGVELNLIFENLVDSVSTLPGFLAAIAYLLGLLFGVSAIFKLKEHVENPDQNPLRTPIIRFLIGGAMFALPIIFEAVATAFSGGEQLTFGSSGNWGSWVSGLLGTISTFLPTLNVNNVLANIIDAINEVPGFIMAVAYLLGLILTFAGLLKIKEHVENPDNVPMREGVIRLLAAGALFSLPFIYEAMFQSLGGDGGLFSQILSLLNPLMVIVSFLGGTFNPDSCLLRDPTGLIGDAVSAGDVLCTIIFSTGALPAFLIAISYVIGLVLGVWGILKLRDHVLDPTRTTLFEGLTRLLAGGGFFALPLIVEVVRFTISPGVLIPLSLAPTSGFREDVDDQCNGLDGALGCFMDDLLGPAHLVLNFFSFVAGMILIMIGISRLLKGAQEGAKAPGGIGTIMTFVTGGLLLSYNEMMRAMTATIFLEPISLTRATLRYTDGMNPDEIMHAHTVISAILKFLIIVGLISFVRGLFIIRGVAEGSGQASLMAGMTHIVAGALAVNMGSVLNAIQATLGITTWGIRFALI